MEPLGTEGKAREVLFKRVMKLGWIRVRYNPSRQNTWFIEVDSFFFQKSRIKRLLDFLVYEKELLHSNHRIELWDQTGLVNSGSLPSIISFVEVKNANSRRVL